MALDVSGPKGKEPYRTAVPPRSTTAPAPPTRQNLAISGPRCRRRSKAPSERRTIARFSPLFRGRVVTPGLSLITQRHAPCEVDDRGEHEADLEGQVAGRSHVL